MSGNADKLAALVRDVIDESARLDAENRRLRDELATARQTISNLRKAIDNLRENLSRPFMEK